MSNTDPLAALQDVVRRNGLANLLNEKHPAYLEMRDALSPLLLGATLTQPQPDAVPDTEPCMFPNLHEPFYCRIHADVRLRMTDERCRRGVTLTQPQPDAGLREALGRDAKDGDGMISALWWALDLIDQYDAELIRRGDPIEMVRSFAHQNAQRKARASLDFARAALRSTPAAPQPDTRPTGDTALRWWVEGALERLRDVEPRGSLTDDAIAWLEDGLAGRPTGSTR